MSLFESDIQFDADESLELVKLPKCDGSINIGILAAGQGGTKIALEFHKLGYPVIFTNTSQKDLDQKPFKTNGIRSDQLVKIGNVNTEGSGKNPNASKDIYSESTNINMISEKIISLFDDGIEKIIVIGTMGGGCGTGAVLPLVAISIKFFMLKGMTKEQAHNRVGVITTLPKVNESIGHKQLVLEKITELSKYSDEKTITPLFILDNEIITPLFSKKSIADFYPSINSTFIKALHVFNHMSNQVSELGVTLDKADLDSILNCGGHLATHIVHMSESDIRTKGTDYIRKQFNMTMDKNVLLQNFDLRTSKYIGMIVVGSESIMMNMEGLQSAIEDIKNHLIRISDDAILHSGLYTHATTSPNLPFCIYLLFGGMVAPVKLYQRFQT